MQDETKSDADLLREQWGRRYGALGIVQRRYLFVTLLLLIFFWTLNDKVRRDGTGEVDLPLLRIVVDASDVLAFSPSIILLFLLAYLGALNAATKAKQMSGYEHVEPFDHHPTLIDMLVYTRKEQRPPWNLWSRLAYPVVLLGFLAWTWWLQTKILITASLGDGWERQETVALVLCSALTILVLIRFVPFTWRRVRGT